MTTTVTAGAAVLAVVRLTGKDNRGLRRHELRRSHPAARQRQGQVQKQVQALRQVQACLLDRRPTRGSLCHVGAKLAASLGAKTTMI